MGTGQRFYSNRAGFEFHERTIRACSEKAFFRRLLGFGGCNRKR
jgi:hypothetical protein